MMQIDKLLFGQSMARATAESHCVATHALLYALYFLQSKYYAFDS